MVPDALPELRLDEPLVGWKVKPYHQYEVVIKNGKPILRLERKDTSEKTPSIHVWLGEERGLDGVAAVHVRCDARWKDVKVGPLGYMFARIVTMMRDTEGKVMHPPDHGMTSGTGSRDWHHCESVFKVTDDMEDLGVEISMLGSSGCMEVKNLSVVGVHNRRWVPGATVAVLVGWVLFVFLLIRCHVNAPVPWRACFASAGVVAISWFFVFPQTKGQLFPVFENFEVGAVDLSTPPPPVPLPVPVKPDSPPEPAAPVVPTPAVVEPPKAGEEPIRKPEPTVASLPEPSVEPIEKPEPEAHSSGALHKFLRLVDNRLPVAHTGLFIGVTLLILFVTGRGNQWRIPLALAVLSELVPELMDHLGGWDDWADVLQNFAGVGLALLIWKRLPTLRRISLFFDRKPATK